MYEGMIGLSADEWMGALMIGLALSLASHGICILGRERAKDPLPLLCGLNFAVSALSMAIGFGHSRYRSAGRVGTVARNSLNTAHGPGQGVHPRTGGRRRMKGFAESYPTMKTLFIEADIDGDGHLTPEEAAEFVKEADQDGNGSVDAFEIDRAQAAPISPPIVQGPRPLAASPG